MRVEQALSPMNHIAASPHPIGAPDVLRLLQRVFEGFLHGAGELEMGDFLRF